MAQFVKGINPGRLNKRVKILRYEDFVTELGQKKTGLVEAATVWAELRPMRGTEFLEYYRSANALQFKVTIRYRSDLTEKDVLEYNGRQFEINSIINIMEGNVYQEVFCTESKDKLVTYKPTTEPDPTPTPTPDPEPEPETDPGGTEVQDG